MHGSFHRFLPCGGPNGFENRKYGYIIKRSFYSVWYNTGFYLHSSSFCRNRIGLAVASNTVSEERRLVQIKSRSLQNTVK